MAFFYVRFQLSKLCFQITFTCFHANDPDVRIHTEKQDLVYSSAAFSASRKFSCRRLQNQPLNTIFLNISSQLSSAQSKPHRIDSKGLGYVRAWGDMLHYVDRKATGRNFAFWMKWGGWIHGKTADFSTPPQGRTCEVDFHITRNNWKASHKTIINHRNSLSIVNRKSHRNKNQAIKPCFTKK